jgi:CMP-N-acetylneuraminic acid synthetase
MNADTVLIAIPARGGSKRLRRKNLAPLGGKPMLAWTIEAAIASELAQEVFVCTEDEEIARVAEARGAAVYRIPASMAGDEVSSTTPCLALHDELVRSGRSFDLILNLQPTSPLRGAGDIRGAHSRLQSSGADFLVSVTPIDPHYFHWAVVEKEGGFEMYFGAQFLMERPRLPPVWRPNGAIKLARAARLKEVGNYFGKPLAAYPMPEERSIHVATAFDLACAETMLAEGRHVQA